MNDLQTTQADRLRQLHGEIITTMRATLDLAIEAGAILHEVKAALPHGDFTAWVETNAGFSIRTAQRYMKIHENREVLKNDSVSLLTDAHRMLTAPKEEDTITVTMAKWWMKHTEVHKRVVAMGVEWETLKHSESLQELIDYHDRCLSLAQEAAELLLDAQCAFGRALNELEAAFSSKEDTTNFLNICKVMDTLIENGTTVQGLRAAGCDDEHVKFFQDWSADPISYEDAARWLRLVQ